MNETLLRNHALNVEYNGREILNRIFEQEKILRDLIIYIIYRSEYLTQIRIQKLFYLCELRHIEKLGRRMSNAVFYNYKNGMYSPEISDVAEKISGSGDIIIDWKKTKDGYDAQFFKPNKDRISVNLDKDTIAVIDEVLEKWKYKSTEEIVNFAKNTKLFLNTPYGEQINFDDYVEECFSESLEKDKKIVKDVLKSEKEYKEGKGKKFNSSKELIKHLKNL